MENCIENLDPCNDKEDEETLSMTHTLEEVEKYPRWGLGGDEEHANEAL